MRTILGAAFSLAAAGIAAAADFPANNYYTAPAPLSAGSWVGPYLGANVGYELATVDNNPTKPSGIAGGIEAGYAAGRFMPFVTGGGAFGDIRASTPALAGGNTTNAGWTVGAGIEFALVGNWTAKAEYLYVDLGKLSCGAGCGAPVDNVSFTANIVRGGINYRF